MTTHDFLKTLYGEIPIGYLTLWRKSDKRTTWYPISNLEKMAADAEHMASCEEVDVYYGVGVRRDKLENGRGKNEDIIAVPALWIDIDVADPIAHKQGNLPPSIEAAVDFLDTLPLKPTIIINSGYGVHAYWKLDTQLDTDEPDLLKDALLIMQGWQRFVNGEAKKKGWKLDSVHDAARVMRLPGTMNYKNGSPKTVCVLKADNTLVHPVEEFVRYKTIPAVTMKERSNNASNLQSGLNNGICGSVINSCAFIQNCLKEAERLTEPEWHAMITNLAPCSDGRSVIHKASAPYPGYDEKETDQKIGNALKANKPHTCEYIKANLPFRCPVGGCGVRAPIVFSLPLGDAIAVAKRIKRDNAFDETSIAAMAYLYANCPSEYGRVRDGLRGQISLRDLERAVKQHGEACQLAENADCAQEQLFVGDVWRVPVEHQNLELPTDGWIYTQEGVYQVKTLKRGFESTDWASSCPIYISGRVSNADGHGERLEVSFYRDFQWNKVSALRSEFYERRGIISIGNSGLIVTGINAERLIQYLGDFERLNRDSIPVVKAIKRMGWISKNEFIWGPHYGGSLKLDYDKGSAQWAEGYVEAGNLEAWIQLTKSVLDYPVARFMLAGSFAAPLMKILKQRIFFIHCWGPTQGGKTAALKTALSVWGDPLRIMTSFNGTSTAMEWIAGFYNDLPLGIDERQVIGSDQEFIDRLVYSLAQGKGKARGCKDGGIREVSEWRAILLTTGEEALSSDRSPGGVSTRAIELYGLPLGDNSALASKLHRNTSTCYGLAGPKFVKRLIQEQPDFIQTTCDDFEKRVKSQSPAISGSHASAIACVITADFFSGLWIWGLALENALAESCRLLEAIVKCLDDSVQLSYGERAYDYLFGWVHANNAGFYDNPTKGERLGLFSDDRQIVYIFPHIFERVLKEGGFNTKRVKKDWAASDTIIRDKAKKSSVCVRVDKTTKARLVGIRTAEYGRKMDDAILLREYF